MVIGEWPGVDARGAWRMEMGNILVQGRSGQDPVKVRSKSGQDPVEAKERFEGGPE